MENCPPVADGPAAPASGPGDAARGEDWVIGDQRIGRGGTLLLLAVAISAIFFQMVAGFLMALLLAAVLAGLAHPTYRKVLEATKGREGAAAALTLVLGLLVVVLPLLWLLAVVAQQAVAVGATLEPWVDEQIENPADFRQRLGKLPVLDRLAPYEDQILAKAGQLGARAAGYVVDSLATGTAGTAKFFLQLFVMLYGAFYFLQKGRGLLDLLIRYVPLPAADSERMLSTFTSVTRATLKGTLVIGLVQGALAGAAFALAGIPGSLFLAVIIAVLSLVPGIGPAIVYVPAVLYLAYEGRYGAAAAVGVWCFGIVSTIDNVLRPKLVGKDTKMPELLIFLGTLGGLAFFGAAGIVVGPIVAALFLTVWDLYGSAVDEMRPDATPVPTGTKEGPRPEEGAAAT